MMNYMVIFMSLFEKSFAVHNFDKNLYFIMIEMLKIVCGGCDARMVGNSYVYVFKPESGAFSN